MSPRRPFATRCALFLALVLAAAACGESTVLAPNQGTVLFMIGSEGGPVAVSSPTSIAGLEGSDSLDHDDDNSGPGDGDDRLFHPIQSASVTFASVLARNLDGVLENVEMDLPVTVDIVTLETGRQVQLPEGALPVGTYDQVVVVMTQVEVVLWDGTEVAITPPGGGWTAIAPLCPPVEVLESGTSTVALTLDVRNAFLADTGGLRFVPRFKRPYWCAEPMLPIEPVVQ
jgi:hypothetical protein